MFYSADASLFVIIYCFWPDSLLICFGFM